MVKRDAPVPSATFVNNFWHSVFSIVGVYINNLQIYTSNGLYTHSSYNSNNCKGAITKYTGIFDCERYDLEKCPEILDALLTGHFTGEWKCLVDPMASSSMVNWLPIFSPNLKCFIQLWELPQIRGTRSLLISDKTNVSVGILECSL